jgi:hypothetical protein
MAKSSRHVQPAVILMCMNALDILILECHGLRSHILRPSTVHFTNHNVFIVDIRVEESIKHVSQVLLYFISGWSPVIFISKLRSHLSALYHSSTVATVVTLNRTHFQDAGPRFGPDCVFRVQWNA